MPKRTDIEVDKYGTLLDLSFLPREAVERIDDIFDSYFGLGIKFDREKLKNNVEPKFPNEVASLSSPELGNRLGEFTGWFSYLSDKMKYVVVATNYLEGEMGRVMDNELSSMLADKGSEDLKKAKARTAERYVAYSSYYQKLNSLKMMLDIELKRYDKCIQSLSREVSRRENNGGF